ncbi:MAG: PKD domain-containing protein, partial [Candidatus Yanofskybacteria bacterium]|nr:PKD domain-containing protein [Candidatus Yanofskybacteria bacterium]
WTFSDPGDSQSAYQVQIDDQSLFNSPEVDSCPGGPPNGTCASGNTSSSYFTGAGILQFNTSYQTRVRVWDSNNTVSPWTEGSICNGPGCAGNGRTWKTPKHAYPQVDFTWTPLSPSANQSVQFTDQSIFYDSGGGSRNWTWTFGDGGSSTQQNPAHTYTTLNNYNINLSVEDKDDYSCSNTKTITVKKPVPFWKEIAPRE